MTNESRNAQLDRVQRWAWIIAAIGALICVIGVFVDPAQFFRSYLVGYLFWVGMPLGCLVWLTVHFMAGGVWSLSLRRMLEAGVLTILPMTLLFVPIAFGLEDLYIWTHAEAVAESEILLHKAPYLNAPFFLIRAGIYFLLWIGLALLISRWSGQQDRSGDLAITQRLRMVSGPALLIYGFSITFASVDWIMSLEPEWFSTIFGVLIAAGQALTAFAVMLIVLNRFVDRPPLAGLLQSHHIFQLGNLLLTAVILWSYLGFIQYLIIWSGNIPEEVIWYIHRLEGGWQWLALIFLIFGFIVPFAVLLSRAIRLSLTRLSYVALLILVVNWIHLFWLTMPTFHTEGFVLHWLDLAALLAVGGVWLAAFLWLLGRRPLLPAHDRVLEGIRAHGLDQPPETTAERRASLH